MADERIKATIYGRNRWAFYQIGDMEGLGEDDSAILEHIMTRLLAVDHDLVREHKLSVSDYQEAGAPGKKPKAPRSSGRGKSKGKSRTG